MNKSFYIRHGQITLGAHYDTGDFGQATKVYDLVVHDLYHVERVLGGYRVYKYVAMDADSILRIYRRVLILEKVEQILSSSETEQTYLSSSVYDLTVIFNSLVNDAFDKGGFDCRIIRIHKMVLKNGLSRP